MSILITGANGSIGIDLVKKLSNKYKVFVSKFNYLWLLIFSPGFIFGILIAFQINL